MRALQVDTGERFAAVLSACRNDPGFSALDAHPVFGEFGRVYYPAVFGERRLDASFAVSEGDRVLAIVPCASGEGRLDYYGSPIRLFLRSGLMESNAQRAVTEAFSFLDKLTAERKIDQVAVFDDAMSGQLSLIGKQCLNRRATGALQLTGLCALEQGESGMRRGLRKSFQSLVNWGQRNLRIEVVGSKNADEALFARYREFHAATAGRVTRSKQSWDIMFEWIAAGRGELILGYLATGELVTGTMVVDGATHASYASGVYDRERFEQPLGHWPLWLAMLHSAKRGMRVFDLGDLPLPDAATEKEVAIGYFKRGFATDITTRIAWNWNAA
jgi:GNAT acetyltransferase-like protein